MSDSTSGIPPVPTPSAPPGWYDDGSGRQRYWDGIRWTEHYADAQPAAQHPPAVAPGGAVAAEAPRKSRKGLWITIGVVGGLLVLLLIGGIVAAALGFIARTAEGVASGGGAPVATAPAEPSAEPEDPDAEPAPEAPVGGETAVFGETWEYTDGLAVTVAPPTPFEPSDSAFPSDGGAAHVLFEVTIANGSADPYEPLLVSSLQSGTSEGEQVFDSANGLEGPPSTTVLPGREVTFVIGYAVADPEDLVLQITPGFIYAEAIFVTAQ